MASAKEKRERDEKRYGSAKRWADNQSGERTAITMPEGFEQFKLDKKGAYYIDLLPYKVGKGNPAAEKGELYFERTYFVHSVGPKGKLIICAQECWDKKCAVCDQRAKMQRRSDSDEDLVKSMYAKKRQLLLPLLRGAKKAALWDISYHNFGKQLKQAIDLAEGRYDQFFRPDLKGRTLRIGVIEESFSGHKFMKVVQVEFKKRDSEIDEALLEGLPCLDDLLIVPDYDKVKKLLLAGEEEDDEPVRSSKHRDDDDEDDDDDKDDSDDDEDDDEPKSSKKKSKDDDDEDDDDDDPPAKKSGKKKKSKDDDDEDDDAPFDDDDDEDDDD